MSYEVRVWHEDDTLMGVAEVEPRGRLLWQVTFSEVGRDSGYAWPVAGFSNEQTAESYARKWAEGYLEWLDEQCDCWANDMLSCGVMTRHGFSIQYCRDGFAVDQWS